MLNTAGRQKSHILVQLNKVIKVKPKKGVKTSEDAFDGETRRCVLMWITSVNCEW